MIGSTRPAGWRSAARVIGGLALISAASTGDARGRAAAPALTPPAALVPVATLLNEVKCDYLDFAYSDYARQQRLPLGKVRGELRLTLSRIGTAATLGVPVAPGDLRLDETAPAAVSSPNGLTIPFELDPKLALNPAASGLDCAASRRLSRTILDFTQLAAEFAQARRLEPAVKLRSPIRYRGQFMLRKGPGGVDVLLLTLDPARVGRDVGYLQAFDLSIETGTPSWFADVGPATAEPRPAAVAAQPPAAPPPSVPSAAPRIELRRIDPPVPGTRPRFRVPTAPRPAGAAPARRCVADASGELACY
ncbi:hypothetical protein [Sphingomonas sp.]|uniref:hypothetical protein n=1 Tax=Sphingomonas sp. TaxID=28214 RepID=UPI0035C83D5C